jgi:hypothetical protein
VLFWRGRGSVELPTAQKWTFCDCGCDEKAQVPPDTFAVRMVHMPGTRPDDGILLYRALLATLPVKVVGMTKGQSGGNSRRTFL